MPLHPKAQSSLASFKSRPLLSFWYQLKVVLEKKLNRYSSSSSIAYNLLPLSCSVLTNAIEANTALPVTLPAENFGNK